MGLTKVALLVDPQEAETGLISSILKKSGFEVVYASDTDTATQLLFEWSPHLVVLDLKIGQSDGIEWLQTIKKDHHKSLLTVVLTGSKEPVDVLRAAKAGIEGYLIKPSDEKTISDKVAEVSNKIEKHQLYTLDFKDKKGILSLGSVTAQLNAISETGLILSGEVHDFDLIKEIEVSGSVLATIGVGEKVKVTTAKTEEDSHHRRLAPKNRIYCKGIAWAAQTKTTILEWVKSQDLQRIA